MKLFISKFTISKDVLKLIMLSKNRYVCASVCVCGQLSNKHRGAAGVEIYITNAVSVVPTLNSKLLNIFHLQHECVSTVVLYSVH